MAEHRPSGINLRKKSKTLELEYPGGESYSLPCEYLRVYSPSAEVMGHGPGQEVLQTGKMHDNIVDKILSTKSLQQLYTLLLSYPTIGPFLAYQYAIDINYSDCIDFGESDFTQPGPGALGGISKCFSNVPKGREREVIEYMHDIQQDAFESQGLEFKTLWGRPLQYIDIQNLFCEVDKYARVKHPDIKGNSDRTRIKRKFKPSQDPIEYFYPPKWGINAKLNDITQHNLSYQTT